MNNYKINNRSIDSKYLIILLVAVIESGLFLILMHTSDRLLIGNDNLKLGLPLRYIFSDAIQNGYFPFWDPFSGLGTPLFTIYMSSLLSPIVIFLSSISVYDIRLFTVEITILNIIGFFGMYLWLSIHSKWNIALLGALAFSLSPLLIPLYILNVEAIGSIVALPWFLYSVYKTFIDKKNKAALVSASLTVMFTSGYLGLNILIFVYLIIWFFLIMLIYVIQPSNYKKKWFDSISCNDIYQVIKIIIMFLALISPLIYQTWANFDINYFIGRTIDQYYYSANLNSLVSILDTTGINPYIQDKYGAVTLLIFIPSILICGIIINVVFFDKKNIHLAIMMVIVFIASLSSEYAPTVFINEYIPFMKSVRIHAWLLELFILYAITFACLGLEKLSKLTLSSKEIIISLIIYNAILLITFYKINTPTTKIIIYIICNNIGIVCLLKCRDIKTNIKNILAYLVLILITAFQLTLSSRNWDHSWLNILFIKESKALSIIDSIENINKSNLLDKKYRRISDENINSPYFEQIPVVVSYNPQRNPIVTKIIDKKNYNYLQYYWVDTNNDPYPYEVIDFTLNEVKFKLKENSENENVKLTIPFSNNWKIHSNEKNLEYKRSEEGIFDINLKGDQQFVTITYRPKYLFVYILLSIICWLTLLIKSIIFFIKEVRMILREALIKK